MITNKKQNALKKYVYYVLFVYHYLLYFYTLYKINDHVIIIYLV